MEHLPNLGCERTAGSVFPTTFLLWKTFLVCQTRGRESNSKILWEL